MMTFVEGACSRLLVVCCTQLSCTIIPLSYNILLLYYCKLLYIVVRQISTWAATALAVSAHTLTDIGQRLLVNDRGVNWLPSSPLLRQDVAESQGVADNGAMCGDLYFPVTSTINVYCPLVVEIQLNE